MPVKYKLKNTEGGTTEVCDTENGKLIPMCPGNWDYEEYLLWVAAGNTADAPE